MKIYFTASARGVKQFKKEYDLIFDIIGKLGHTNIDNLIRNIDEKNFYEGSHDKRVNLFKQAMDYINRCDVVVLEVSLHSLSMGYLMNRALDIGKPVVALYYKENKPYFASGIENDKLQLVEYDSENLETELKAALENAQDNIDVRFNFFISPAIGRYLDWISKEKKIPRSVYLRALIEREMRENEEYNDKG